MVGPAASLPGPPNSPATRQLGPSFSPFVFVPLDFLLPTVARSTRPPPWFEYNELSSERRRDIDPQTMPG